MPELLLVPTEVLLAEMQRRYPNCLIAFEIPANAGDQARIHVHVGGAFHVGLGLCKYSRVSLANALIKTQHPYQGPF